MKRDLVDVKEHLQSAISTANAEREGLCLRSNYEVGTHITQAKHESRHLDDEFKAVTAWLSSFDFTAKQIDFLNRCQAGTGEWLLSSPRFQNWLDGEERTLWCPGLRKISHPSIYPCR